MVEKKSIREYFKYCFDTFSSPESKFMVLKGKMKFMELYARNELNNDSKFMNIYYHMLGFVYEYNKTHPTNIENLDASVIFLDNEFLTHYSVRDSSDKTGNVLDSILYGFLKLKNDFNKDLNNC